MPRKRLGTGVVIKLAGTAIGCILSFVPPGRTREEVDVTCLDDAAEDFLDADPPNEGVLEMRIAWEPGDTNSELLDTLFSNTDQSAREGAFTIEWTPFTPLVTDAFSGRIMELAPERVEKKGLISRVVRLRLTTPVTRT